MSREAEHQDGAVAQPGGGVGGQGGDHGAQPVDGDGWGFARAVALLGAVAAVGAQGQPGRLGGGFGQPGVLVGGQHARQRAVDTRRGVSLGGQVSDVVRQRRSGRGQACTAAALTPVGVGGEVAGVGDAGVGGQAGLHQPDRSGVQETLVHRGIGGAGLRCGGAVEGAHMIPHDQLSEYR